MEVIMISISLCMIVKNEEKTLRNCLDSVKEVVDEIIIVDTGSEDKTVEIAQEFTDKVYFYEWKDDFASARNFSFSKATKDFILWLDADDILLPEDKEKLLKRKQTLTKEIDMVMLKYNMPTEDGSPFSFYRERLIQNFKDFQWEGRVHEVIPPRGKILYENIAITHNKQSDAYTDRNLKIYQKMLEDHISFGPRETFYYARELMYNDYTLEAIKQFQAFLEMDHAFLENKIEACLNLNRCYMALNDKEKAFQALVQSFRYDTPRAEICTCIGNFFLEEKQYNQAIYWYKKSLTIFPNPQSGGFINYDMYTFIPYLNLCVCYYRLNNLELAEYYNELAGREKPNSTHYLYNKNLFKVLKYNHKS